MAIRRTRTNLEDHYTQLDNEWLRDSRLSLKARGLFAQILSHREGWSISIASLVRANPEGDGAIRSALAELMEHGYLIRGERERDEQGRLGDYEYTLWAGKGLPEAPVSDQPAVENPTQDDPTPKKTIEKKTIEKNPPVVPHDEMAMSYKEVCFEAAWATWPKKEGKKPAREKFMRLAKTSEDATQLGAAIARYAQAYVAAKRPDEIRYIRQLATWLNQDGWEDPLPQPEASRSESNMAAMAALAAKYETEGTD